MRKLITILTILFFSHGVIYPCLTYCEASSLQTAYTIPSPEMSNPIEMTINEAAYSIGERGRTTLKVVKVIGICIASVGVIMMGIGLVGAGIFVCCIPTLHFLAIPVLFGSFFGVSTGASLFFWGTVIYFVAEVADIVLNNPDDNTHGFWGGHGEEFWSGKNYGSQGFFGGYDTQEFLPGADQEFFPGPGLGADHGFYPSIDYFAIDSYSYL